ncbi:hypothetical protein BDQ17DRAFT_261873 [Cyathus striatus]|nr:hypothetical protein BDQ17DRAFT_261873 [Cyathus striatus]
MESQGHSQPELGRTQGFFAQEEQQPQQQHQHQQQVNANALAANKQIFPPHMLLSSHSVPVGGVGLGVGSGGDMYDLPFLDLHYYNHHHNGAPSPGIMGNGGAGMGMNIDGPNQALDLASSLSPNSHSAYFPHAQHNHHGLGVNNGLSTNLAALGLSPSSTPATTSFLKNINANSTSSSSLQGALRQPSPMPGLQITGNFLNGGTIKASRHQRGQSAVCPQDLILI